MGIVKEMEREMDELICECGHTSGWHNATCLASGCNCQKSFGMLMTNEILILRAKLDKMTDALLEIGDKFEGLPPGDIANKTLAEIAGKDV